MAWKQKMVEQVAFATIDQLMTVFGPCQRQLIERADVKSTPAINAEVRRKPGVNAAVKA
ncbi:MAG: hypothetical protein ACLT0Y_04765 [Christensenellales bacterium]